MIILWIILFSILGSIGAIVTAAAFLLFRKKIQELALIAFNIWQKCQLWIRKELMDFILP